MVTESFVSIRPTMVGKTSKNDNKKISIENKIYSQYLSANEVLPLRGNKISK